jgi:hypothetical protein
VYIGRHACHGAHFSARPIANVGTHAEYACTPPGLNVQHSLFDEPAQSLLATQSAATVSLLQPPDNLVMQRSIQLVVIDSNGQLGAVPAPVLTVPQHTFPVPQSEGCVQLPPSVVPILLASVAASEPLASGNVPPSDGPPELPVTATSGALPASPEGTILDEELPHAKTSESEPMKNTDMCFIG